MRNIFSASRGTRAESGFSRLMKRKTLSRGEYKGNGDCTHNTVEMDRQPIVDRRGVVAKVNPDDSQHQAHSSVHA